MLKAEQYQHFVDVVSMFEKCDAAVIALTRSWPHSTAPVARDAIEGLLKELQERHAALGERLSRELASAETFRKAQEWEKSRSQ